MSQTVLVAYATKKGSTQEVAEAIAGQLEGRGLEVDLLPAADVETLDRYGAVVLGGALYMGRWRADARRFLADHGTALSRMPVAVFAMGPLTLEDKDVLDARHQLDGALAKVPDIEPIAVAIFGGVIDPAKLRFPFNRMPATDARDWAAIRDWADEIASVLSARTAA